MPSIGITQAWAERFTGRFAYWAILVWGALNIVALATSQLPLLFLHDSVGNGDGYILLTVDDFRHTGLLYPPIGPAHLTPTLYSPLLYLMHAAAWAVIPTENPYVGPRLVEFAWYLLCLLASAMLAKELVPARRAFSLGLLLAASFSVMTYWVLQLRSDFPGIACSLFALWFLMSRRPSGAIWAGLCAGLALQFKITFVAAAAAGFLWLLLYRRWGDLIRFSVSAGVFAAVSYGYFAWREPQMFTNILMFSRMIPHPAGVVAFIRQALAEPALLLALAALLPILHPVFARPLPRWQLLLMFLTISFAIATFSSLQAGTGINYFYEILLASTPLAVLGLLRLYGGRLGSAGLLLGLLLVVMFVLPAAARTFRGMRQTPGQVTQRNRDYENLRQALVGVKVLSSLGDVTILVPEHVITEPVLLNYLVLTKGADVSQLAGRIRDNGFDAVVTQPADYSWRGVQVLERQIYQAIVDSYRPYCLLGGKMLFHLPRRKDSGLEDRLKNIGCEVVTCGPGMKCPGLGVQVEAFQP